MTQLDAIRESLRKGNSAETRKGVVEALGQGIVYEEILGAMLEEMEIVGQKFRINELFVPEVLIIGRAFNVALEVIKPMVESEENVKGIIVIGTVRGDLHDVGKNLVKMLMASTGMKVIDLGVDVSTETFVEAIRTHKPDVLAMSALLTTTMVQIKETIKAVEKEGLREGLTIFVGGAPVTGSFAEKVGADYYASDAGSAAELIRELMAQ